jgi:hypothetical protein
MNFNDKIYITMRDSKACFFDVFSTQWLAAGQEPEAVCCFSWRLPDSQV